jgi:Leucine-rich repeat (LRR) protein
MKKYIVTLILPIFFIAGCTHINQEESSSDTDISFPINPTQTNETIPQDTQTTLNLKNQNLQKIPGHVFNQTDLESLDVSYNKLEGAIQAEIRQLQNLTVLKANNNTMTGVPAEIGQLSNLEVLDLSNNQLTGLPYELGNLKNLKTLNISGNYYSTQDLEIIQKNLPKNTTIIK